MSERKREIYHAFNFNFSFKDVIKWPTNLIYISIFFNLYTDESSIIKRLRPTDRELETE